MVGISEAGEQNIQFTCLGNENLQGVQTAVSRRYGLGLIPSWASSRAQPDQVQSSRCSSGGRCRTHGLTCRLLTDVFVMVSREEWGARATGCRSELSRPANVLVVHHVPGLECHNQTVCTRKLQELQAYHIHSSWCDVAYK